MSNVKPSIQPYGDAAILIRYPVKQYSEKVVERVQTLASTLRDMPIWEEVITGYREVLVCFNPALMELIEAQKKIDTALKGRPSKLGKKDIIDIPVVYGGQFGPDIDNIVRKSGLKIETIIKRHSKPVYTVCMMGFIPGFTFLSEAPKALHHPRHAKPRLSVPAGSVGIAGWQTGIYGLESPGGWQIIGRTPLKIFDKNREAPFLLKAGDKVQFCPIAESRFDD